MKSRLILLCLLVLTACVAPGPQVRIRISGGEKVLVFLKTGKVEGSESNLVKIGIARLMVSAEKKNCVHHFGLEFAPGVIPTHISVEDVADEKPILLMTEDKPELTSGRWSKVSEPIDIDGESLKWLHDIDDSFRIYRFNITLQDGQKITLLSAAIYISYFKAGLMQVLKPTNTQ
jgi:hypothetical protein